MGTAYDGAQQAIDRCLSIGESDSLFIISDRESRDTASMLKGIAVRRGAAVELTELGTLGPRPAVFTPWHAERLATASASIFTASAYPGEMESFRAPLFRAIEANHSRLRHAHMVGITPAVAAGALCGDYDRISRDAAAVFGRVRSARRIAVTTPAGTNLEVHFAPDYLWRIYDGIIRPGSWMNLPEGEVFTCPFGVDGRLVVDGVLGDGFDRRFGLLAKYPVSMDVVNGRAVPASLVCANAALADAFRSYLFDPAHPNACRVGEFAIGLNGAAWPLIGNILSDEKALGTVHLAFGDADGELTGAPWSCDRHIDGVLLRPTVLVDGVPLIEGGIPCW